MPGVAPTTMPMAISAEPLLRLHVPPARLSLSNITLSKHTLLSPVMIPAVEPITPITSIVDEVPHEFEAEYEIVSIPPARPVTRPESVTEAMVLSLLPHVPPPVRSVSVSAVPWQSVDAPVITPTFGNGFTVIVVLALAEPHALL